MDLETALTAMQNRLPVKGPRPFRPLLITGVLNGPHGYVAHLQEAEIPRGDCMRLCVEAMDPTFVELEGLSLWEGAQ